jgi:peptidoglycan/LPS O-acetylase OafA/YrhL
MNELRGPSSAPIGYRLGYRGDVEGLRAVAILLVVAAHADAPWLAGGFVGVDVFFVLSGYLITALLLAEITTTGSIDFVAFYARRFRRLLPALLLMLVATFVLASFLLSPVDHARQGPAGAAAAVWLSNIYFAFSHTDYFSPGAEGNLFLHTWSLGVEEQFYLLWPIFLLAAARRARASGKPNPRGLQIAMIVVLAVSLVPCLLLSHADPPLAFYLTPTRAWQFALGGLAFLSERALGGAKLRSWAGWLGLAAILGSALWLGSNVSYPGAWALLPSVGAAAVLVAGAGARAGGVSRLLSLKPLQAIGNVSYAWYLWHWPVLLLGAAVLDVHPGTTRLGLVGLSLGLAFVSYHVVEKRVTASKGWIARPVVAVVAALSAMVVVNVGALAWENDARARLAQPVFSRFERVRFDLPAIYAMGCDDWIDSSAVRICEFGRADAPHVAVAIGDSVGLQWFPAMAAVFDKPDWRLLVITKSSCPMVDETIFYARIHREYTECTTWRKAAIARIGELKPDLVMLGSSVVYDLAETQWIEGTARVLEPLAKAAQRVYVLQPTPLLPFDGPSCLAPRSRLQEIIAPRDCSSPADDRRTQDLARWLRSAAQRFPNAVVVDMNDVVCPGGRCSAEQRGTIVYRDAQHLTAEFTLSLADELGARLGMTNGG